MQRSTQKNYDIEPCENMFYALQTGYTSLHIPLELDMLMDICATHANMAPKKQTPLVIPDNPIIGFYTLKRIHKNTYILRNSLNKEAVNTILKTEEIESLGIISSDMLSKSYDISPVIWIATERTKKRWKQVVRGVTNKTKTREFLVFWPHIAGYTLIGDGLHPKPCKNPLEPFLLFSLLLRGLKKKNFYPKDCYGVSDPFSLVSAKLLNTLETHGLHRLKDLLERRENRLGYVKRGVSACLAAHILLVARFKGKTLVNT